MHDAGKDEEWIKAQGKIHGEAELQWGSECSGDGVQCREHGECRDSIQTQECTEMEWVGGGWCSEYVSIS